MNCASNRPFINDQDWHRIDDHLDRLLSLTEDERDAELTLIATDDPKLSTCLRRLLADLDQSELLESVGGSPLWTEAMESLTDPLPEPRLGTWTVLERIGRGGMAEVFKAERKVNDVRQLAAIKIMTIGLHHPEQLQRFQQETAILARLDDPRLSRLIDAGTAADGRPWLAMEYIDGEAIDSACDRLALTIPERVRLLIDVAMAVDHAHRQLVVHRDLKPGNILLDGTGKVRLLDFGIAKIMPSEAGDAEATATRVRAYTQRYACPEQLSGAATGVAVDIYQLGILAYILLSGTRPFIEVEEDPARLLNAMREGPLPPSRRCQDVDPEFAKRRGTTPARWPRLLRGDLDSIVIQAMQPDPSARYPGARELADDLQRWLQGDPIKARVYSRSYRLGRWLRRYWFGVCASAMIAVLLLGYAATVTWHSLRLATERNEAQLARQRAESIQAFLSQVFASFDPYQSDSRGKSVDQLLVEGMHRVSTEFPDQPLLASQILIDLGQMLMRRGRLSDAEEAVRAALQLREEELGPDHPEVIRFLPALADVLQQQGRFEQAHAVALHHLHAEHLAHGERSVQALNASLLLAASDSRRGDNEQAVQRLTQAGELHLELLAGESRPEGRSQLILLGEDLSHQLGVVQLRLERFAEAESALAATVSSWQKRFGALDPRTTTARKNLAYALRKQGRYDDAQEVLTQVLAAEREIYGGSHWQTAYTLGHLAGLAGARGEFERSAQLWFEAEAEAREALDEDHPWPDTARFRAAEALMKLGDEERGRPILEVIAALHDRDDDVPLKAARLLQPQIPASSEANRAMQN